MVGRAAEIAFDFIEVVQSLRDRAALSAALNQTVRRFGFDTFIMAGLSEPGASHRAEVLLSDWPQPWRERYIAAGDDQLDPVARHARGTTEPFLWSQIACDPAAGAKLEEARARGVGEGFAVPIVHIDGAQSIVSLAGGSGRIEHHDCAALGLICIYAFHRARQIAAGEVAR